MLKGLANLGRVLLAVTLFSTIAGCVSQQKYNALRNEKDNLSQALLDAEVFREDLQARNADLMSELDQARIDAEGLRSSSQEASEEVQNLRRQLDDAKNQVPQDWQVRADPRAGTISYILSEAQGAVLFNKGSHELTADFKTSLARLSQELLKNDNAIQIEGHTDSDPVSKTKKKYPLGNSDLGARRALSVFAELRRLGVPEYRMSIASYGANVPVMPNDSEQGKMRNRRVEVKVFIPRS